LLSSVGQFIKLLLVRLISSLAFRLTRHIAAIE
jgi:hypothetical protein